jgi:hypothetical protein
MAHQRSTVVGVFADRGQAQQALGELRRAGFNDNQITLVRHREEGVEVTDVDAQKAAQVSGESKAGEGAAVGAGVGAVAGALMGLIPGVGPVLSIGTLAGVLFGVVAGGAGGGLVGALVGQDFPEEEARVYERELKAGRTLVGVKADGRLAEASAILTRCGAYDASSPQAQARTAAIV